MCCGDIVTEFNVKKYGIPLRDVPCFHFHDKVYKHLLPCHAPTPHWSIAKPCYCNWWWRTEQGQRLCVLAGCSIVSTARRKLVSLLYCQSSYIWHSIANNLYSPKCRYYSVVYKKSSSQLIIFVFFSTEKIIIPCSYRAPLSHLTSCTPTKSNLHLANSLAAAVSEPPQYRLLTFQVRNLISLFHCLGRTKGSFQVRGTCYALVYFIFLCMPQPVSSSFLSLCLCEINNFAARTLMRCSNCSLR